MRVFRAFFRKGVTMPGLFCASIGGKAAQQWRLAFSGWEGSHHLAFTPTRVRVPSQRGPNAWRLARRPILPSPAGRPV
jgi:hypothetical protein